VFALQCLITFAGRKAVNVSAVFDESIDPIRTIAEPHGGEQKPHCATGPRGVRLGAVFLCCFCHCFSRRSIPAFGTREDGAEDVVQAMAASSNCTIAV
jgi:hypothetical protein